MRKILDHLYSWGLAFLLIVGLTFAGGLFTAGDAGADDSGAVYNALAVARNQAGGATPVHDATLRSIAQARASAAAKRDSAVSSTRDLSGAITAELRRTGYKEGRTVGGQSSSGDPVAVADLLIGGGGAVKDKKYNRVGVGVAYGGSGYVYVIAVYAEYKSPAVAQPAPVQTAAPQVTKAPTISGSSGSKQSSGSSTPSSAPAGPTAAEAEAAEEARAKAAAEVKAEADAEAKAKAEAEKKAEAERKADEEAAEKALEEERERAREEQEKAQAERDSAKEEAQAALARADEASAEKQRSDLEKQRAEEQQAAIKSWTLLGSYVLMGAGVLVAGAGCFLRGRRLVPVPEDIEVWADEHWDAEAASVR